MSVANVESQIHADTIKSKLNCTEPKLVLHGDKRFLLLRELQKALGLPINQLYDEGDDYGSPERDAVHNCSFADPNELAEAEVGDYLYGDFLQGRSQFFYTVWVVSPASKDKREIMRVQIVATKEGRLFARMGADCFLGGQKGVSFNNLQDLIDKLNLKRNLRVKPWELNVIEAVENNDAKLLKELIYELENNNDVILLEKILRRGEIAFLEQSAFANDYTRNKAKALKNLGFDIDFNSMFSLLNVPSYGPERKNFFNHMIRFLRNNSSIEQNLETTLELEIMKATGIISSRIKPDAYKSMPEEWKKMSEKYYTFINNSLNAHLVPNTTSIVMGYLHQNFTKSADKLESPTPSNDPSSQTLFKLNANS